tara:strand:+ start:234 stop:473 length:240 start_codon:yes stop_codon:yes gene_type:complete
MIPKHHYSAEDGPTYNDTGWIEAQLDMLPISIQKKVAEKYSDIYLKLITEGDTKARFRCNSWLRKTVAKYKVTDQEGLF